MDEKQFPQEPKLRNGYVGTAGSLKTFDTADADTDMCGLDHGYVVCTIADG